MNYQKLTPDLTDRLGKIVGPEFLLTGAAERATYGQDQTDLLFVPEAVLRPANTQEVSAILRLCNEHRVPVTVRGGGSGLSGAALPVFGGIVMAMDRFNRIIAIDERNFQVTTEPGVITEVLQEELRRRGLFYPPDPSSRGWSHIGGNIATNAGGPKAVKYGVVREYVLNLEVVLPNGDVIETGANTLKNSTGYSLTQLMTGSEGTLGVITRIVLKLLPYPSFDLLMLAPFRSAFQACEAVSAIFRAGVIPSGLEFMERRAIDWAADYVGTTRIPAGDGVEAHLLIEVDGNDMDQLYRECETIQGVLEQFDTGEVLFADSAAQKEELWKLRRNVSQALKVNKIYKKEDTVVPRAELATLLQGIREIEARYGFQAVCFGHAGDGNLHVNILRGDAPEELVQSRWPAGVREIFSLVRSLGGTLSGEHGIGYVQRPFVDIVFSEAVLALMRGIKQAFDPHQILNPGKIF